jgi:putative DNA primase/helicase
MTASDPVARVLANLDNVKPNGTGHTARCPGHDDRHNSLTVDTGNDGQALIHCHAGCDPQRVVGAIGLTLADLYPPRAEPVSQNGHGRRIVATYDYRDESGGLLYQGVRFEPKDFKQRRPDGKDGWIWSLTGVRHVPYRLLELLAADPAAWVLIVEGEKDADRLAALGFTATTNAAGAGKWKPEYTESLRGRRVVIIPDNDEAGEKHANVVARALHGVATEVRVLRLPDLPSKGDASDWIDTGGTHDALAQLIDETPRWQPDTGGTAPSAARLVVSSLSDVTSQPVDWHWPRWLPRGKFHLLGGHAGDGKSTLLASLAATGSRGGEWPDGTRAPRAMRTLFVLGEDSAEDTLKPRLALHNADMNQIFVIGNVLDEHGRERFFNIGKHLDLLEDVVVARGIDWIVIDPLTTIMPGADRNAEGDTRDALTPLIKLGARHDVSITGVAHVGKGGDPRRAAQKILGATAFHALARVVWMVAPDEDERMVLGVVKSNLAMKPASLVWTRDEDGPIQWEGVAARDVEDLLSNAPQSSPRADAAGFLREFLAGGSRGAGEVEQAAKKSGISWSTVRRAADAIPVKKWKATGTHGLWYWSLPDGQPRHAEPPAEPAESNLLTPKDSQVSKLSKFAPDNVLNSAAGEYLHATTPIVSNGHAEHSENVMEGAQLAHPEPLRGEQVTLGATTWEEL